MRAQLINPWRSIDKPHHAQSFGLWIEVVSFICKSKQMQTTNVFCCLAPDWMKKFTRELANPVVNTFIVFAFEVYQTLAACLVLKLPISPVLELLFVWQKIPTSKPTGVESQFLFCFKPFMPFSLMDFV
jgi:hypothetical protein